MLYLCSAVSVGEGLEVELDEMLRASSLELLLADAVETG
jgi:hypothetical protein